MRKIKNLTIFAIITALIISFCAVNFVGVAEETTAKDFITETELALNLREFIGTTDDNRLDRTSFTEAERNASEWLFNKVSAYDGLTVEKQIFTVEKLKMQSQNIIAKRISTQKPVGSQQKVVIGAHYDNFFGDLTLDNGVKKGTGSTGALDNGTGVAVVLSLCKYFSTANLPFDIEFVFFGAEEVGSYGSKSYVDKKVENADDILLMVNINRIGGDNLYLYTDEYLTQHEQLLRSNADTAVVMNSMPAMKPLLQAIVTPKVDYTHFGMFGDQIPFFNKNINTANFFGGNMSTIYLSERESSKHNNIAYTPDDNIDKLESLYPNYPKKMKQVANTIVASLNNPKFVETMIKSDTERYDYSFFMNSLVANLIKVGIVLLLIGGLILTVKLLEKKYPPQVAKPQNPIKLTVFGKDYENDKDAKYIDIMMAPPPSSDKVDKKDDNNPFDGF